MLSDFELVVGVVFAVVVVWVAAVIYINKSKTPASNPGKVTPVPVPVASAPATPVPTLVATQVPVAVSVEAPKTEAVADAAKAS